MPAPLPPKERIIRNSVIDPETGCWNWHSVSPKDGCGRIGVNYRKLLAHRVSFEDFVHPIPDGMEIDHLCQNRRCVNPGHLDCVTHAENMKRAGWNGRMDRKSYMTHCKHGHEYTLANTGRDKDGHRVCRACCAAKTRARWRAKRMSCEPVSASVGGTP